MHGILSILIYHNVGQHRVDIVFISAVNPLYPVNITMLIDILALCNIYWQAVDQSPQRDKYYHKKVDKSTTITDQNCANYVAEGSGKRTQAIIHKDN